MGKCLPPGLFTNDMFIQLESSSVPGGSTTKKGMSVHFTNKYMHDLVDGWTTHLLKYKSNWIISPIFQVKTQKKMKPPSDDDSNDDDEEGDDDHGCKLVAH